MKKLILLLCPGKIGYDDLDNDHEKVVAASKRHGRANVLDP